jgi:lipopolysaccharide biosynthesis regulator YciM
VAAAYANAGQFDKACQMLTRIIDSAPEGAEAYRQRLKMYQKQQPYREPQPADSAER